MQVIPSVAWLRPRLEVYNAANALIGAGTAATAGQRVLLQSLPVAAAGVYTVRVSGADGTTGQYSLFAALNASLEEEDRLPGATNNSPAAAQPIGTSFIGLATDLAKASRGAVSGTVGGASDLAPVATVFSAGFEAGAERFTVVNSGLPRYASGPWNRTARRGTNPGHSATHSFWYGNPATGN